MSLTEKVRQAIRKLAIKEGGVHIVAEWKSGGSDAHDLPIYTKEELIKEFPNTKPEDAEAFFNGERDGFVIATWKDSHHNNEEVTDTAWYPMFSENEDGSLFIENDNEAVDISFRTIFTRDILIDNQYNAKKRIKKLSDDDLEKLMTSLRMSLSSPDLGEKGAWDLLVDIEKVAIKENNKRRKNS